MAEPLFPLGDWRWGMVAAIGFVVYAASDHRLRKRIATLVGYAPNRGAPVESRVPTTVDPEQSNINCLGGMSLFFSIFVTIENRLDVDVQLKIAEVCTRMKDGSGRDAGTARFQGINDKGELDADELAVSQVRIPKRSTVDGWFLLSHDGNIRAADFLRFELQLQAVGEPVEVHNFEPYDWNDLKRGQSGIVVLP